MCKKLKNITFFLFELNVFEYPKTLITMNFFLFFEGGRFVVYLVAAKVILQHMFFLSLSYFLDNIIFEIRTRYDGFSLWKSWEMPKCYTSPTFLQWFWPRKSCKFFPWFQIFTKIRFSHVCFLEYEHLKHFVWKDDNIFVFKRKIGNQAHFPIWQWYVPSVDLQNSWAYIFFGIF